VMGVHDTDKVWSVIALLDFAVSESYNETEDATQLWRTASDSLN